MLFDKEQSLFHRLKVLFSLLPFGSPHFTLVKVGVVNSVLHFSLVLKVWGENKYQPKTNQKRSPLPSLCYLAVKPSAIHIRCNRNALGLEPISRLQPSHSYAYKLLLQCFFHFSVALRM
jgi:hypothetical protein